MKQWAKRDKFPNTICASDSFPIVCFGQFSNEVIVSGTLRGLLGVGYSVTNNGDFTSADQEYTDTDTSGKVSKRANNTSTFTPILMLILKLDTNVLIYVWISS